MDQKKMLLFISHASEDNSAAKRLAKRLREDGFDPWLDLDRLLPGQIWDLEIEKALHESDAILLCFSSLSIVKEGYIQREYKRAMRYMEEKPEGMIYVIPVRLDDCELPHFIREIQWVDYPVDYDRLVQALQIRAGGIAMSKKDSKPKAKKPKGNGGSSKSIGGSPFNIEGGIHAGRDVVMGNQYKTIYQNQPTINITSTAQFMDELRKIREEIEKLKSQPEVDKTGAIRLELAQAEIDTAMEEAGKEKPVADRIKSTLDNARDTMDKIGGSVVSAINLGTTLGNLAMLALQLFH